MIRITHAEAKRLGVDVPRVKRRRTHTPGIMNCTEQRYALVLSTRELRGEIMGWTFEEDRFVLADDTTYLVDFTLWMWDGTYEYHEVKGAHIWEKDRIKLKVAAAIYPEEVFRLAQWKRGRWAIKRV